jgi:hypothetical protein
MGLLEDLFTSSPGGPVPQSRPLLEDEISPEQKYNLANAAIDSREFTRKPRGLLGGLRLK